MTTSAERYRAYQGAPLFAMGFRPFFLFGAVFAACALPLWIIGFHGWIANITRDWHVHEMLFGYLAAVIAGFLLTAVPNWTGRLPVSGASLVALFFLWTAGRAAILFAPQAMLSAVVDGAFLFVLALIIGREVLAGRNVRNMPVCVLIMLLASANTLTHLRALSPDIAALGERGALAVIAMLIAVIGGRITPSFTRNWMARRKMTPEPAAAGRFDLAALIVTALALFSWAAAPNAQAAGLLLMLAGVLNFARLFRWKGWRTTSEFLVIILHLGYGWLALALLLLGASILAPLWVASIAGIHALTSGAFGVMTLAVMTRATRGHTGQPLTADAATVAIYVLVNFGAALRVASPFFPYQYLYFVVASAVLWSAAFATFAVTYGPLLYKRRVAA